MKNNISKKIDKLSGYYDRGSTADVISLLFLYVSMRYIFPVGIIAIMVFFPFIVIAMTAASDLKIVAKIFFSALALSVFLGMLIVFNPIRHIRCYRIVFVKENGLVVKKGIFAKRQLLEWSKIASVKQIALACILIETKTDFKKIIMDNRFSKCSKLKERITGFSVFTDSVFVELLKSKISEHELG